MNIRLLNRIQNVFLLLVVLAILLLTNLMHQNQQEIIADHLLIDEAQSTLDEMRVSSDRLTMMARLYLLNGDTKYKDYYFQILNIRRGLLARPADYDSTYWDRVLSGQTKFVAGKTAQSLDSRIASLNLPAVDLQPILDSEANSNQLAAVEILAFSLWEQSLAATDAAHADQLKMNARSLLYDKAYMDRKDSIMAPLRYCEQTLHTHSQLRVQTLESLQLRYLQIAKGAAIAAGIIFLLLRILATRFFVIPLRQLTEQALQIIGGNFTARNRLNASHEMGALGSAINQMLDVIESDRQRLAELSFADGLTGIANRRRFDDYLNTAWELARREKTCLSLLLFDIDFFKKYNDHYGHQAGDDCLTAVAKTLAASLKRKVDLAARYGGEEFACILPNTTLAAAEQIAERIRLAVCSQQFPHAASPLEPFVTVSCGVASLCPTADDQPAVLLLEADHALYQAKQNGRNQIAASKHCSESDQ